ncbi:hypothetical protein [Vibrio sp. ABG19]|uniref:hypothetical protein n=1 Tax=Vibrio sp. ABG19 TaxID=2817385 RepID=UPI00249EA4B5|nr:hypothetical protein [Vibrio sp. ABG19]WGY45230.1 hypothetical protein J0X00_05920 [Vibrio sp. ABG19]
METVLVDTFIPKLRQLVNVPLAPLMNEVLVQAAQEFCRESGVVRYTRPIEAIESGSVLAVVGSSELNGAGSGSYIASEIMKITSVTPQETLILTKGDDYKLQGRDVVWFGVDIVSGVVHCSIEPTLNSTHVPQVLFDEYQQAICYGAAHLLMLQPDSDWHNPQLAFEYRQWFVEAMRSAKRFALENGDFQSFHNPTRRREFF